MSSRSAPGEGLGERAGATPAGRSPRGAPALSPEPHALHGGSVRFLLKQLSPFLSAHGDSGSAFLCSRAHARPSCVWHGPRFLLKNGAPHEFPDCWCLAGPRALRAVARLSPVSGGCGGPGPRPPVSPARKGDGRLGCDWLVRPTGLSVEVPLPPLPNAPEPVPASRHVGWARRPCRGAGAHREAGGLVHPRHGPSGVTRLADSSFRHAAMSWFLRPREAKQGRLSLRSSSAQPRAAMGPVPIWSGSPPDGRLSPFPAVGKRCARPAT